MGFFLIFRLMSFKHKSITQTNKIKEAKIEVQQEQKKLKGLDIQLQQLKLSHKQWKEQHEEVEKNMKYIMA